MPESAETNRPASAPLDALTNLLQDAGIEKSSTIRVTGPAGLASMLWFCHHGYEQVSYSRGGPGPADENDFVFVPQTCHLDRLKTILSCGPHPREGSVLIVQTPNPGALGGADPVQQLLQPSGYDLERCLRGRHRALHVARRSMAAAYRSAA
jgi:hypothetical protein